mmetsp:Transcript_113060/g.365133  ORF Transcript_113060/g.365133 Transcript_113060/m.365133 type:complete len:363 (-) Transcript_113060:335-1423(-)
MSGSLPLASRPTRGKWLLGPTRWAPSRCRSSWRTWTSSRSPFPSSPWRRAGWSATALRWPIASASTGPGLRGCTWSRPVRQQLLPRRSCTPAEPLLLRTVLLTRSWLQGLLSCRRRGHGCTSCLKGSSRMLSLGHSERQGRRRRSPQSRSSMCTRSPRGPRRPHAGQHALLWWPPLQPRPRRRRRSPRRPSSGSATQSRRREGAGGTTVVRRWRRTSAAPTRRGRGRLRPRGAEPKPPRAPRRPGRAPRCQEAEAKRARSSAPPSGAGEGGRPAGGRTARQTQIPGPTRTRGRPEPASPRRPRAAGGWPSRALAPPRRRCGCCCGWTPQLGPASRCSGVRSRATAWPTWTLGRGSPASARAT